MLSSNERRKKKKTPRRGCITRKACKACRDKKAKCDGESQCRRCVRRGVECVYSENQWTSKESLKEEIRTLREKLQRYDRLMEALQRPGPGSYDAMKLLMEREVPPTQIIEKLQAEYLEFALHKSGFSASEPVASSSCGSDYTSLTYDTEIVGSPATTISHRPSLSTESCSLSSESTLFTDEASFLGYTVDQPQQQLPQVLHATPLASGTWGGLPYEPAPMYAGACQCMLHSWTWPKAEILQQPGEVWLNSGCNPLGDAVYTNDFNQYRGQGLLSRQEYC